MTSLHAGRGGAAAGEVVELVTALIRNACVNDGTPDSGHEERSATELDSVLAEAGVPVERFEAAPGRVSLVARIDGTDPDAPSLCLLGHTDVVPAEEARWRVDPFGGEVHDGYVWGRGAIDMLNQTAAQAVAVARLAKSGFRPRGDLVFFAPADEEAGGRYGTDWMLQHHADAVAADYVITEGGGFVLPQSDPAADPLLTVMVAEKGPHWRRLHFTGTPGHGSMPYDTDNAVAKVAEAALRLHRYLPPAAIDAVWAQAVDAMALSDDAKAALLDPVAVDTAVAGMAENSPAAARVVHACTRTTLSPNLARAGTKINVIAGSGCLEVDGRALPGVTAADFDAMLRDALGSMFDATVVEDVMSHPASVSPANTPLWDVLQVAAQSVFGPCRLAPWLAPFTTDARFYRRHGTIAYGFTLHDHKVDLDTFGSLFHGDDERVSVEALGAAADVYEAIVRGFLA
jgi:acetylornithine deacetylase/succinyl-diaminopimelate desuccinylase-like protein